MSRDPSGPGRSRRPLVGLLVAEAVSITGTRVSMIAIPLFVLAATGSATRTGLVAVAEMVPLVLLKVLSGPVIDRVGARRVSVTCDVLSAVVVAAIPLTYDAGVLPFWLFLVLVAVAGALRGPGDAAKYALVPPVVASAQVPMERVTGLLSAVERTASMAGAALAGVLVATLGPANALFVDAASFAGSAVVLLAATAARPALRTATTPGSPDAGQDPAAEVGYLAQLRQGWDFMRRDRLLLGLAVMVALTNMIDLAWTAVLLPVWAVESGSGAAALGLLLAVWGGCSAIGALAAAAWAERLPRFRVYLVAFLVTGLPRFLAMALDAPLPAILALFALGGFCSGFLNPILGAVEFERIPAHLVGRVSSIMTAMAWGLMPLGGLLGGVLTDGLGLSAALLAAGVAYLVVTLAPAFDRHFREMDTRPQRLEPATA